MIPSSCSECKKTRGCPYIEPYPDCGYEPIDNPVDHPSHYTFGKYEVIDVLEDWFEGDPLLWQVGKYISRAGRKGSAVEDLKKAAWYLNRKIKKLEGIK